MSTISIIIPAYNVENYIDESIQSVLNQTILPDEIIIINDGSTDKTFDKLKNYSLNDLVTVVHTHNMGQGLARNKGIELSKSEYIYFFDSDDLLEKNFIERMRDNINKYNNPDIILFSGQSFFDEQYNSAINFFPNYDRKINEYFNNSYNVISTLMSNNSFYASPCLYISRKDLWEKKSLAFKPILHEDEDLIFQLMAHSTSSVILKDVFFHRRVRSNSVMTKKKSFKNLQGYLTALYSMYEFKDNYPELFTLLEPLWKKRITHLTYAVLRLMKYLRYPLLNKVLIRAIYDSLSYENTIELITLLKKRLF